MKIIFWLLCFCCVSWNAFGQPLYEEYFHDNALRVDLVHSGDGQRELFAVSKIVEEPHWSGPVFNLIDRTNLGQYRLVIYDRATNQAIYAKGYSSLFGEWMVTPEAGDGMWRAMDESVRFPYPKRPFELVIERREPRSQAFTELQRFKLDTSNFKIRHGSRFDFEVIDIACGNVSPQHSVDFLIVPDGYTAGEKEKLLADARRFARVLLETSPFTFYRNHISIRVISTVSKEQGADEPRKGIYVDTVLDSRFNVFDSPRYLLPSSPTEVAEVASAAKYDAILVMVNSARYGGGGIFNQYAVFPADAEYAEYIMRHEIGHSFAGLADEYYAVNAVDDDDEGFYSPYLEPWEPNITIQTERSKVKWRHLILDDTPVPTPDTPEFDSVVGLFEGAGYRSVGLYRATRDSKMFNKGPQGFGPVNEEAIVDMIRYYMDEPTGH